MSNQWLNPARRRFYAVSSLLVSLGFFLANARAGWRAFGQPMGFDYLSFWAAAWLAVHGQALAAYSMGPHGASDALLHAALAAAPRLLGLGPWFYPPGYLLLMAPFAWLPYVPSFIAFMTASAALWVASVRKIAPRELVWLLGLGLPALWVNFDTGQNGLLSAALAGLALRLLPRRPGWAGIAIGVLALKPQLAMLFPLLLLCSGQWRAFWSAALSCALLNALALLAFGWPIAGAFVAGLGTARGGFEQGALPLAQMASVAAQLRVWHAGLPLAYAVHGLAALLALGAALQVWRRSRDLELRACALIAATFLTSPYLFNYDTVWFGLYIAFFTRHALVHGWRRGERAVLVCAWVFPPFAVVLASHLTLVCAPPVAAALLFMAWRRGCAAPPAAA
jgi:hypothetical protein